MSFAISKDRIYNNLRVRFALTPTNPYYTTIVNSKRNITKRDRRVTSINTNSIRSEQTNQGQIQSRSVASISGRSWVNFGIARDTNLHDVQLPGPNITVRS